ncbi:hypothetical protein EKH55_3473 [Sinorhizobium alkalisoli]|nr:hypothetical protein EKH55_3473 [Sinorhizobium alkalisoli]
MTGHRLIRDTGPSGSLDNPPFLSSASGAPGETISAAKRGFSQGAMSVQHFDCLHVF